MNGKRALVCGLMPEFEHDSGSRVLYDLITMLQELGWEVTLLADHSLHETHYARILQQQGIPVYLGISDSLEWLVTHNQFDVAILALWFVAEPFIPVIRRLSPRTRIIVHSIDLHFVRQARRVFSPGIDNQAAGQLDSAYGDEMRRELNTYAASDLVLTVSDKEAQLVDDLAGVAGLAHTLPDNAQVPRSPFPFSARRGILFLGYFLHLPNIDAAEFLLGEILRYLDPSVLQAHPIQIVGSGSNETLGRVTAGMPDVHIVDWVPSVVPYLHRARITVIPVRYGAGTKGKLIQALMAGTPSVATTIGIEGLQLEPDRHVLVADDAAGFAACMVRLLQQETLWSEIAQQGRAHILENHSRETARARLAAALAQVERAQRKT